MKVKRYFLIFVVLFGILFTQCQQSERKNMVLLPVKDDPTVSFRLVFKVGSAFDPKGKEGLAALTATLLTNGGTKKHSYEEILRMLYPMAASVSSQVDKEMTVIYGRVHKDNLNAFYEILKEIVLTPGFREEDFTRIKSNYLNYIQNTLRYSSDEELGKAALYEFIFKDTPYGHLNQGHVSSLKKITIDDIKAFYQKYFTRANLVIGLGGGYDDSFADLVRRDFRQLPQGVPARLPEFEPPAFQGLNILIVEKPRANATAISFGYPIKLLRGQPDFYAMALANSWFGEHRNSSSHLYQVIREARGLNYGDYSYIEHFPNGGRRQFPPPNVARRHQIFEVWIRPVPKEAGLFAFRAALRELNLLVSNGLSEQQFNLTREFLSNYILHYAPTTMMKLGYALDDNFYGIDGHFLELFPQKIKALTKEQVNRTIKTYLQDRNIKVVFVTSNARKLKDMLINNKPSPIKYKTPKPQSVLEEDKAISAYPLTVDPEKVTIVPVEKLFE
ncbi:MAG: insulinase family protein [Calditrichaeota bacterium]|nr:insulinase family protein [Calditrichota bacterium]